MAKDLEFNNIGRNVLPLRIIDNSELILFKSRQELKANLERSDIQNLVFSSERDNVIGQRSDVTNAKIVDKVTGQEIEYPFLLLRYHIAWSLKTCVDN